MIFEPRREALRTKGVADREALLRCEISTRLVTAWGHEGQSRLRDGPPESAAALQKRLLARGNGPGPDAQVLTLRRRKRQNQHFSDGNHNAAGPTCSLRNSATDEQMRWCSWPRRQMRWSHPS
jgi:hypothetical protein